ncbi:uncharacterized protein si:dkey-96l17.6 [Heptranchias perlo]|uniref:uncharacterized protein si:dkey-96l17.6 n=1 Tax=Heptranchias perlo TaxID=212740 RepID=UPI00355A0A32
MNQPFAADSNINDGQKGYLAVIKTYHAVKRLLRLECTSLNFTPFNTFEWGARRRDAVFEQVPEEQGISNSISLKDELDKRTSEVQSLVPPEQKSAAHKLQAELKQLMLENKNLTDNINSERTLRKKYYNMVEDLKGMYEHCVQDEIQARPHNTHQTKVTPGKIRVFCRIRPLSKSELAHGSQCIVHSPDEYTVTIKSNRGVKEFQFDQVFNCSTSQEEIFKDTNRLIQSAVDGYNVCIFAYGQTGSGKTFTMIGDKERENPGISSRAFKRIFQIIDENQTKFTFKVLAYMLELYNEQLLDLFVNPCEDFTTKLEIKKDKKGFVYIQGAEIKEVTSAEMLCALFEQGCTNRHTAATKMNTESSRSHLIVGVTIKSINLSNGSVTYGKLSLVDLAGSERASKTGAADEQLKCAPIFPVCRSLTNSTKSEDYSLHAYFTSKQDRTYLTC